MGNTTKPSLEEMVADEGVRGVSFTVDFEKWLDTISVPTTKDEKPDVKALVETIKSNAETMAEKYVLANKYDPRFLPGYERLFDVFESNKGAIEGGKLTPAGKRAIINLYNTQVDGQVEERRAIAYSAETPEVVDKSGVALAEKTSNRALIALINAAKTAAEKAARVRPAITDLIGKMRQWYQVHGNLDGFKSAYTFAPAYK